jgi:peptide deformylase
MKLIKFPDPILKQKTDPWDFTTQTDAEFVEREMLEIMKANNGRGLAGNQVGLLKQVFVMRTEDGREFGLFNPVVKFSSEVLESGEEGCLSFPDLWLDVKRPIAVDVEYLDRNGKECTISLVGIDARCFLHELDHLNGVCFTDSISPLKLTLARKKQLKKRKYNG